MKKLPVAWLCLLLIFGIIVLEFIATTVNYKQDQLNGLLNVFLPVLFGIASLFLLAFILLFLQKSRTRKIYVLAYLFANLIFGCILHIQFFFKLNEDSGDMLVDMRQPMKEYQLVDDHTESTTRRVMTFKGRNRLFLDHDLFFSRLSNKGKQIVNQTPSKKFTIKDHDFVSINIRNTSDNDLAITKAAFLKGGIWSVSKIDGLDVDDSVFPIVVGRGQNLALTLTFTASVVETKTKLFCWKVLFNLQSYLLRKAKALNYQPDFLSSCLTLNDQFILLSDSAVIKKVDLHGLWQYRAEGDWEPDLQKTLNNLNFRTNVGFKYFDNHVDGNFVIPNSDEIAASYFFRADQRFGVKITQLAAYHAFNSINEDDDFRFFLKGQTNSTQLFKNEPGAAQSIFPKMINGNNAGLTSFYPMRAFGFITGKSNTDRTKNFKNKIGVRVWKALDIRGNWINNTYILGCDFIGQVRTNYDYQDNVYLVENIRPINQEQVKLVGLTRK